MNRDSNAAKARRRLGDGVTDEIHILPVNDLVDHDSDAECVCGPTAEPVERDDGTIGWLHIHHSLDGRELTEGKDDE